MKEIKYKLRRDEHGGKYAVVPCPAGKEYSTIPICVGSALCLACRNFVSDDVRHRIITCKSKKIKE